MRPIPPIRIILVVLLLLSGCAETTATPTATPTMESPSKADSSSTVLSDEPGVEIQGHRGARGIHPENTLPSFEAALDAGVDTLELDLHWSADDQLIVWHDPAISSEKCGLAPGADPDLPDPDDSSTPPSNLQIRNLTLAEIQQFRCDRNPDPDAFPDQSGEATPLAGDDYRIIALAELFAFVEQYATSEEKEPNLRDNAAQVRFNIETKRRSDQPGTIGDGFDGSNPGPFEQALVAAIEDASLVGRATIQSFDHRSIWAVRQLNSEISLAALTSRPIDLEDIAARGAEILSPRSTLVTPSMIEEAHALGLEVIPWTINDPEQMIRLIEMGVDGLITDRPDLAVDLGR